MPVALDQPKKKYKLLRSIHSQMEATDEPCVQCVGKGKTAEGYPCGICHSTGKHFVAKLYEAGKPGKDIVESSLDLEAVHGREKFQSLDRLTHTVDNGALLEELAELRAENARLKQANEPSEPALESMTVAQLKEYAKSFDPAIDLTDASNKAEMVSIIQGELDSM